MLGEDLTKRSNILHIVYKQWPELVSDNVWHATEQLSIKWYWRIMGLIRTKQFDEAKKDIIKMLQKYERYTNRG